jgi:hypothetical protein
MSKEEADHSEMISACNRACEAAEAAYTAAAEAHGAFARLFPPPGEGEPPTRGEAWVAAQGWRLAATKAMNETMEAVAHQTAVYNLSVLRDAEGEYGGMSGWRVPHPPYLELRRMRLRATEMVRVAESLSKALEAVYDASNEGAWGKCLARTYGE